jgi:hypothetical protein
MGRAHGKQEAEGGYEEGHEGETRTRRRLVPQADRLAQHIENVHGPREGRRVHQGETPTWRQGIQRDLDDEVLVNGNLLGVDCLLVALEEQKWIGMMGMYLYMLVQARERRERRENTVIRARCRAATSAKKEKS